MPELPEVETVRAGLEPVMAGQRLVRVETRRPDLRFPFPDRFAERLSGAVVKAVNRRGKYLVLPLETGEAVIAHLGMSGRFTIEDGAPPETPGDFVYAQTTNPAHDHVVFAMQSGARITFNDPRRFGFMDLVQADALAECRHFADMGPEPLSPAFTSGSLAAALEGRASPIKAVLLDQKTVAGLGNIYVCEALYRAKITPLRQARDLHAEDTVRLARAIRAVLREAIAAGGSSLRDYAGADGQLGYFQHAFDVYGREGGTCPRRGCHGVVERAVQSGRSTFFCRSCQT